MTSLDTARFRPAPNHRIDLADYDPADTAGFKKDEGIAKEVALEDTLNTLQDRLYAEGKQSLLVVFQAMDAGGKDGAIKKVFDTINPQGVRVASFKAPSTLELSHDFLWRIHQQVPPKGYISIFNRSHYEDVLVVRVNQLVDEPVWRARYGHINAFERLLTDSGTRILKFFLHISKDEQKKRLQARLDDPTKNWKFSPGDLPVRAQWDDYMAAYADALTECNTAYAPFYIVPANKKWFRDLLITQVICETLTAMNPQYPPPAPGIVGMVIPD